ncbi:MAG: L-aspartate oxidase [Planctomycetia bacterium]|nr:L-aspartate oxidase [Planctomycetia bacterium]
MPVPPRRYLVNFNAKRLSHFFTDVLVIGSGIAGLRAALSIPTEHDVMVLCKDMLPESNSRYAQGGIAGVVDPEDRFENHVEDTLKAGAGICDRTVVEAVIRAAPEQLAELIRWGAVFDEDEAGKLALTLEGGHSHRRVVHALGDATGQEIMRAAIEKAKSTSHLTIWEKAFTLDLLTHEGRCVGALVHRPDFGLSIVWAKQTILASGGAGQVYRETTNPPVATADGMALAHRAGATMMDMEFMQFHPTLLYVAGSARYLISEAVRGEGAHLVDKNGHRFMLEVDPRAELAPRDVVSRAIANQMEQTHHACVYLDLSHLSPILVKQRFPGIEKVCASFGLSLSKDKIPVRPGAHYMVGGVQVNLEGKTSLPGLWAAGEVTSSGLHGANRLASNSLLEGLVYGKWCAEGVTKELQRSDKSLRALPLQSHFAPDITELNLTDLKNSLQSLMGRKAGIERDQEGLQSAIDDLSFWGRYVLTHEFESQPGWELQNLITTAHLMLGAMLARRESRGVHFRSDFPERNDADFGKRLISI